MPKISKLYAFSYEPDPLHVIITTANLGVVESMLRDAAHAGMPTPALCSGVAEMLTRRGYTADVRRLEVIRP